MYKFMYIDWLTMYQDHYKTLPIIGDRAHICIDTVTGEQLGIGQPTLRHEGSYSTSLRVSVSGGRVTVRGNPSRFNRPDNLVGFFSLDHCVDVYNDVLASLSLPPFTKCTQVEYRQNRAGERVKKFVNGAVITELHITTNKAVGQDCVDDYIRGLSTQRYRHMIPRLHTNGKTSDWLNSKGNASSMMYPSVYNKAHEMRLHILPKIKKQFGESSDEYKYLLDVIQLCEERGIARFEQKLKSTFLRRHDLQHYGLFNEEILYPIHEEFLALDDKLQVTAMTLENISERLIRLGICNGTRSANTTAMYALQWLTGQRFDLDKKQVQVHRARLRKIGIDIAEQPDLTKHSPVMVRKAVEIEVKPFVIPAWYRRPQVLRVAA